jgi:hypothetical protein
MVWRRVITGSLLSLVLYLAEGTPRKLATATSVRLYNTQTDDDVLHSELPDFPKTVISLS